METRKEAQGNRLFPVFLKLENLRLLIIGGGKTGLEKINAVIHNSPRTQVKLVSKKVLPEIEKLAKEYENISLHIKSFEPADLDEADLVITATGDRKVSEIVKVETKKRRLLVNVADTPDLCDFYLGSIVQKGDLKIAISTNGKSPTLAKRTRELLNEALPDRVQELLDNLSRIRNNLKGDLESKVKRLNEITSALVYPAQDR